MRKHWDIFCIIVDNLGDIGFCWRLARQLANEYKLTVRLWVDDLESFSHIAPEINVNALRQWLNGVEICLWQQSFSHVVPADVVIETFACQLPDSYIHAMSRLPRRPVWINLEHLSAENWVSEYHCLPSPHPRLTLVKHFFFPGFVSNTGGLIRENQLLSFRDNFNENARQTFWRRLGVPARKIGEWRISLFCYNTAPLFELLAIWRQSTTPVYLLVPQLAQLSVVNLMTNFFGYGASKSAMVWQSGQLTVHLIPLLTQTKYDQLLLACDVNFVRGEDSFVRAQWAARPFVWHIYPQEHDVHHVKLNAFLDLYTVSMTASMATAVRAFWYRWNENEHIGDTWLVFSEYFTELAKYGSSWSKQLASQKDLVCNILQFVRNQA